MSESMLVSPNPININESFMCTPSEYNNFKRCRQVVCKAMQEDYGLSLAYRANINTCVYDHFQGNFTIEQCGYLTDKLMKLLFEVGK